MTCRPARFVSGIIGRCHIRQSHDQINHTNHRSLTACLVENWLAFCEGVYSLFVVRLMRSLIGHEAVNGYEEGDVRYAETI
jgi:hypothetical protein